MRFVAQRWAPGKPAYFEQVRQTALTFDAMKWQERSTDAVALNHSTYSKGGEEDAIPNELLVRKKPGERRVALLVSHSKRAPGATGVAPFTSEFVMSGVVLGDLAAELAQKHGVQARVFVQEDGQAGREKRNLHVYVWQADMAIELHGNAGTGKIAGTETWYDARYGQPLAAKVHQAVLRGLERSGREDRGMRAVEPGGRGANSVSNWNTPTVLLEAFFIDNPAEVELAVRRRAELVRELAVGIKEYLAGLDKVVAAR